MNQKVQNSTIEKIVAKFLPETSVVSGNELSIGHIHQTYRIVTSKKEEYILQRFSTAVFPQKDVVANNTDIICSALAETGSYPFEIPYPIPKSESKGNFFAHDDNGNEWRMFHSIKDTKSISLPENAEIVSMAANAFAVFQKSLAAVDHTRIVDPIVGFMDNPGRFAALKEAVSTDVAGRASQVKKELKIIDKHAALFPMFSTLQKSSSYQPRVTHGDMKLNNLLFDANSGKVRAVIDLDTCMVGDYLYDYGDFLRIAASTAVEDEADLSKVTISR